MLFVFLGNIFKSLIIRSNENLFKKYFILIYNIVDFLNIDYRLYIWMRVINDYFRYIIYFLVFI